MNSTQIRNGLVVSVQGSETKYMFETTGNDNTSGLFCSQDSNQYNFFVENEEITLLAKVDFFGHQSTFEKTFKLSALTILDL